MFPIADVAATAEPVNAENNVADNITTCPKLPLTCPTIT